MMINLGRNFLCVKRFSCRQTWLVLPRFLFGPLLSLSIYEYSGERRFSLLVSCDFPKESIALSFLFEFIAFLDFSGALLVLPERHLLSSRYFYPFHGTQIALTTFSIALYTSCLSVMNSENPIIFFLSFPDIHLSPMLASGEIVGPSSFPRTATALIPTTIMT